MEKKSYTKPKHDGSPKGRFLGSTLVNARSSESVRLADGFHRVLATCMAGLTEIAADVRVGSQRDAFLYGISANSTHGLARTNADKRKAVALLLVDAKWS